MKSLIAVLFVAILLACTQVTQTTGPTTVESGELPETSSEPTAKVPSAPASGTISLTPPKAISVAVGSTVHVKVVVADASGVEVKSASITASVADSSVLRYTGTDARTISFLGVAQGTTTVIVSASSLQASLTATVTAK